MEAVVSAWKRYIAAKMGVVWQDRFFEHRLRSYEGAEEKARYILNNPVCARLVAEAAGWPYMVCTDLGMESTLRQRILDCLGEATLPWDDAPTARGQARP